MIEENDEANHSELKEQLVHNEELFGKADAYESIERDDGHEPRRDGSGGVEKVGLEFAEKVIGKVETKVVFLTNEIENGVHEHDRVGDGDGAEVHRYGILFEFCRRVDTKCEKVTEIPE